MFLQRSVIVDGSQRRESVYWSFGYSFVWDPSLGGGGNEITPIRSSECKVAESTICTNVNLKPVHSDERDVESIIRVGTR